MYAKLFTSIYQGTLRGNSHGLLVFTNLLAHCDKEGVADIHPKAIAEEVGLSVDQVKVALEMLEAPDDESRSPEENGRRITRMDDHRAWGWRVVNYVKYRAIRDEDDRREQNRLSQARWREKNKPTSASVITGRPRKPQSAHTEAEAYTDTEKETSKLSLAPARPSVEQPQLVVVGDPKTSPKTPPDCPHLDILALWAEALPTMPQHDAERWRGAKADHLRTRWRETAVAKDWSSKDEGLRYFRKLFGYVGQSRFLTGRTTTAKDKRPFVIELEWLVNLANWDKVHEGKYHPETEAA